MTTLLEQAVARARELSAEEQDALAKLMLEEIELDRKWEAEFNHDDTTARRDRIGG